MMILFSCQSGIFHTKLHKIMWQRSPYYLLFANRIFSKLEIRRIGLKKIDSYITMNCNNIANIVM